MLTMMLTYRVRTDTNLTLTVVHDTSSNGIILNDKLTGPGKGAERAYILRDGDIVGLPGTDSKSKKLN